MDCEENKWTFQIVGIFFSERRYIFSGLSAYFRQNDGIFFPNCLYIFLKMTARFYRQEKSDEMAVGLVE